MKNPSLKLSFFFSTLIRQLIIILTISLLLYVNFSKGQLIYIDITPDTTISNIGGFYNLDLNEDGTIDFKIIRGGDGIYKPVDIYRLHDSCYISYYSIEGCYFANAYQINDSIGNYSPWFDASSYVNIANYGGITTCQHSGAFLGQLDKCLGLKLIKNGITYFGWVRIDVASDASWFKMKDYAYNNASILAGQGIISNINIKKFNNKFVIFDYRNEIIIKPIDNIRIINARLINPLSQVISYIALNSNQVILHKCNYRIGTYFLIIETNDYNYTTKLIIK